MLRRFLAAVALSCLAAAPALAGQSITVDHAYIGGLTYGSDAATTAGACLAASGTFPKQTLAGSHAVNAQTGTTYTVANTDQCKLVTLSNSSAVAVTLPQAGAASQFLAGWSGCLMDEGTGAATITPTTSTIDGASSLALNTGQGTCIYSDGTNYSTSGKTGGGASGTAGGDLTGTYPNPTIANNAVTNAKAAQMAAHTIKGNNTGSTANAADLTDTQVTAELNDMVGDSGSGGTKGLVPAPASGDAAGGKYLKADGTWAVPPGGSASPGGSSGDIQYNNSGAFGGRSLSATLDTIGSTQGDVLYRNATGWTVLAPGTSGQLLASGGTSANPSWITASGTGTVTSVTCGTGLTCSPSPITGSGTISLSSSPAPATPQGRLTLQSGTPVMTTDTTAVSTVYYDCYAGKQVPYYDGSTDQADTISGCEVSLTMATSGTGVTNSGGVFDIWWDHAGANRICVATNGSGGGWASDTGGSNTARGTGYSQVHNARGYWTNVNSIAHCYNGTTDYGSISADEATYLGTLYTTAAGQTGMAFKPAPAAGGSNNVLGLWNAYNRVTYRSEMRDSTSNWSYSGTWRAADGSNSNRISYVDGLAMSAGSALYNQALDAGSGDQGWIGCKQNWTSGSPAYFGLSSVAGSYIPATAPCGITPSIGLNDVQAIEATASGTATTFNADSTTQILTTDLPM